MNASLRSLLVFAAGISIFAIALLPLSAAAEPFSDLYVGFSVTDDSTYSRDGQLIIPSVICVSQCQSSMSPVGGIRIGYWFERFPWLGVSGDFSSFIASWGIQSPIEVQAYPITPLLMVRGRLIKQEGFDNGRVQPYLAIGPSIFITTATLNTGLLVLGSAQNFGSTTADIGLDARLGVQIATAPWFGINLEYRYSLVSPSWTLAGSTIATTLSTSQLILGIGAHY